MEMLYRNPEILKKVDDAAKVILDAKHSNHHRDRFFPMLIDALDLKVGAEIGVDKGEFSEHLLSRSKLEKLICIDPWIDDFGSDYRPGVYDPNGNNRMSEALKRLEPFGNRVLPVKATSYEASKSVKNETIDFCFIDGDHSLEGIYTDVYTWIHKVRLGGIIAGHDYKDSGNSGMKDYWGRQLPYRIKTVVDNFCVQYGFKLQVVGGRILSWWFVKI